MEGIHFPPQDPPSVSIITLSISMSAPSSSPNSTVTHSTTQSSSEKPTSTPPPLHSSETKHDVGDKVTRQAVGTGAVVHIAYTSTGKMSDLYVKAILQKLSNELNCILTPTEIPYDYETFDGVNMERDEDDGEYYERVDRLSPIIVDVSSLSSIVETTTTTQTQLPFLRSLQIVFTDPIGGRKGIQAQRIQRYMNKLPTHQSSDKKKTTTLQLCLCVVVLPLGVPTTGMTSDFDSIYIVAANHSNNRIQFCSRFISIIKDKLCLVMK